MEDKIEIQLIDAVACDQIANVGSDIVELPLDSFLESGVLKEIPFFGTALKIYGIQKEIRNQLFLKKVAHFMFALSDIETARRKQFIDEINRSKENKRKFGEAIILLIERAEDMAKANILGRIIKAYIEDKLDYEKAMRLCKMVDRSYTHDLLYLSKFKDGVQNEHDIAATLFACGFLSFGGLDGGTWDLQGSGGVIYSLNEYGKMIQNYVLTRG